MKNFVREIKSLSNKYTNKIAIAAVGKINATTHKMIAAARQFATSRPCAGGHKPEARGRRFHHIT